MSSEKLAQYYQNYKEFLDAASHLDAESIEHSQSDQDWSAAFVLHHVADSEMHFAIRYFNALTIEKPAIIPFNEEVYPTILGYANRDWRNSLTLIETIGNLVHTALSSISDSQWERTSLHPELGEVSLSILIGKAGSHMAAHTEQLKSIGAHV